MKNYSNFLEALGARESRGRYNVVNQYGYLGKYQMGKLALIDAGYRTSKGGWTGKDGVKSKADFLNNPQAQENAIRAYMKKQWSYICHFKLDRYVGTTINGVCLTESGLIGGAHLKGISGIKTYLKSQGKNDVKDANRTPISQYVFLFNNYEVPFKKINTPDKLALSKSKTNKKRSVAATNNKVVHPHAPETSVWYQLGHYNVKRWNIAPHFITAHKNIVNEVYGGIGKEYKHFLQYCHRHLNEMQAKEMKVKVREPAKGDTSNDVTINYVGNITKLPEKAKKILKEICVEAGVKSVTITSTTRNASNQARIMYNNIVAHGVDSQKRLYAAPGRKVIDEYVTLKGACKTPAEIKAGMEKKINEVGSQNVSKHCADPAKISVFDIGPKSVPNEKKADFVDAVKAVKDHGRIRKFLRPPVDPAYHIEIDL